MKGLFVFLFFVLLVAPSMVLSAEKTEAIKRVSLVEYPTGVLSTLKEFSTPSNLIYLSGDPLLRPAPDALTAQIDELLKNGNHDDFVRKGSPRRAELLILPVQTVRVALQHGIVKQIIWVPPTQTATEIIPLEVFRRNLAANGSLTEADSANFHTTADQSLAGEIHARPVRVTTIHNLPEFDTPSVLLIDLSYFFSIYQNEIKTPIFPLVHSTLKQLLTKVPNIEKIVISYSTGYGDVPLKLRFLGPVLANLTAVPERMDKPAPTNWRRFSNNLYMVNFHQVDEIWESALLMTKTEPNNPAWHYNLHEAYNLLKKPNKALTALGKAARLDPGYALEFISLARTRLGNNDYTAGIELLNQASDTSNEPELIKFDLAISNLKAGNNETTLDLVEELEQLSWSPIYFSDLAETLKQIKTDASALPFQSGPSSINITDLLGPSEEKE